MTFARFDPVPASYWRELTPAPAAHAYREGDLLADVVVVGLGAPGLLAASVLAEAGVRVIGVDAGSVGRGAAGANGGFLLAGGARFLHDAVEVWGRDKAHRLWHATLEELEMECRELDPSALRLRRGGSLRVAGHPYGDPAFAAEEVADLNAQHRALLEVGVESTWQRLGDAEALHVPCDGWLDPARRVNLLAGRARAAGAVLLEQEPVTVLDSGLVSTSRRSIRSSFVLVTVDGHLEELLPGLPVRSWQLEMARYDQPSGGRLGLPTYMRWGFDYGFDLDALEPELGGLGGGFVLGGFRDRFLADASLDTSRGPTRPTPGVQACLDQLASGFAGHAVAATTRWAAAVSYTEDLWPMVAEARPGVWVCGGLSGHGNLIGPMAARAMAGHVLGDPSGEMLSWLAR